MLLENQMQSSLRNIVDSCFKHHAQFELSEIVLARYLNMYGLTIQDIETGEFEIDLSASNLMSTGDVPSKAISACETLIKSLLALTTSLNWLEFTSRINHFFDCWIKAYDKGLTFNIGIAVSGSIEFKHQTAPIKSAHFHLFCISLLAQITESYHQYRYAQAYDSDAANYDADSGLPNLHLLRKKFSDLTEKVDTVGFMMMRFEITSGNLSESYSENPELIQEISTLIKQNLPSNSLLYRISLSEFAVIFINPGDSIKLDISAAKLQHAFELSLYVKNVPYPLKPTIACVYKTNTVLFDELYIQARRTLDDAIKNGQCVAFHSAVLDQHAEDQTQLEHFIIEAFENSQFEMYLQPIVTLPETYCVNAELLLRCAKKNGDFIPPGMIIEVIYKRGFGGRFLRWLLATACRMGSELQKEIGYPMHLSVNLTAEDLIDVELPYLLAQSLEMWDLEAQYITLEITENGLLLNEALANKTLAQLADLGCKLSLDDFGTGYSSMSRLRNMPIDQVKVDQSFVRNMHQSNHDFEIVRAIILLAHSLDKIIVAEGVENLECLTLLKSLDCEKIQGYYFSKPLTAQNFVKWINAFESGN